VSAQDSGEERLPYIFPAGDADRTEDERWWVENATDVCRYAGRTLGRNYDAAFSGGAGAAAVAPVISPFLYNVGIDYETFNTTDIPADLTAVTKNFALIRTYQRRGSRDDRSQQAADRSWRATGHQLRHVAHERQSPDTTDYGHQ
jgi:hypothetical protein